ncbi:MAG: hypothetical protein ACRCTK_05580, partial [Alphaproteobacteria bacterium]
KSTTSSVEAKLASLNSALFKGIPDSKLQLIATPEFDFQFTFSLLQHPGEQLKGLAGQLSMIATLDPSPHCLGFDEISLHTQI